EIYGFRFAYVNNRVRYKRTIAKNLITVPQASRSLARLNRLVDDAQIDLVITDFEPLTCHIGHKRRLPVISIDNQHCLTNTVVSYPRQYRRDGTEGNITFKKPSLDGFFADLVSARAIIANSGFSLVTEALHLAKPYLAVPVSHQFEQIFNAYWLEKSGYGAYWEDLNKERVESFLYNIPHYRKSLANYPRQGNGALLHKLDSFIAGAR